jgi:tetratricopeptide (TPR) repeat protein
MIECAFPVRKRFTNLASLHILLVLLFSLSLPVANLIAQGTNHAGSSAVVAKYMSAFQKRDIKAIIDNTYSYQREVAQIKAQNPQALWPKLIAEYNDKKIAALSLAPGYWQNYTESLMGMSGDPTQGIRALFGLIPRSSKWAISETRPGAQGTTVYVTVDYPEISEAPIAGPQLLKQTILNFTLSTPPTLIVAMQKVPKADVFWTGGPDVHTAMAKRYLGAGLWDAAISQLKPLESNNQLSAEGKAVLASAYFQHVTNQCFGSFVTPSGKRFSQFKTDSDCMADVERALALQPNLKRNWVNQLLSYGTVSLQADQPDSASSLVNLASQFSAGDADLENLTARSKEAVGRYYLASAESRVKDFGTEQLEPDLKGAIEIWPDESRKRAVEILGELIQRYLNDKSAGAAFRVLDSMKNLGLRIPPQEVPQFLQFGQRIPQNVSEVFGFTNIDARIEWEKRVRELAAPLGASTPAALRTPPSSGEPSPAPSSNAGTICGDYNSCIKGGIEAHMTSQWQQAITDLEEASKQSPKEAAPWGWLGRVYLALRRHQEATAMWDKTLSLGGPLVFQVCLERSFKPCERGNLSLAPAEVSFSLFRDGRKLFAVAPADVSAMKTGVFANSSRGFINLQVKKEKYLFEYSPYGDNCRVQSIVECPQNELQQQLAVRDYVLQTIPKLASAKAPQPAPVSSTPQPSGPLSAAPSPSTAADICSEYVACLKAGEAAVRSTDWGQALAFFQKACLLEPTNPAAWASRGTVYLATSRSEQASAMWDKALSLGGPLAFVVCHPRSGGICQSDRSDRGNLTLEPKLVSFIASSGKTIFSVPPSEVTSTDVSHKRAPLERNELHLKIEGKNYTFYLVPFGVDCGKEESAYCEEDQAVAQQLAVFNYMSRAIPKLASGALNPQQTKP